MAGKRKIVVEVIGDASSLKKALGSSGKDAEKFAKGIAASNSHVAGSFGSMLRRGVTAASGLVAAYASIAGAKKAVETTEDLGHATLTLSKNLGLSTQEASRWAAVARSRNIDTKSMGMSFGTLSKNIAAAGTSTSKHADAFKQLGVSQKVVKSGNFNAVLKATSDGLAKMGPGAQRTALSMKLFGRGWQTIVPVLRGGSKAMDEQLKLADKYGVTLNGKSVKSVENLIAAQREAKFASMGLQVALGTKVIPVVLKVIQAFAKFVANLRNGTGTVGKLRDKVVKVFGDIKKAVGPTLAAGFDKAKAAIVGVAAGVGRLVSDFKKGRASAVAIVAAIAGFAAGVAVLRAVAAVTKVWAGAQIALNLAMDANPITLAVAAIVAIGVAMVIAYKKSEAFRRIVDGVFSAVKSGARAVAAFVGPVLGAAFEYVKAVVSRLLPAVKQALGGFISIVRGVVTVIKGIIHGDFSQVWAGVKGIIGGALNAAIGVLRAITGPLREAVSRLPRIALAALKAAPGLFVAAVKLWFKGLVGAIGLYVGIVKDAVLLIVRGVQAVARALVGWFVELGKDVIRGLIRGVKSLAGDAANAVKNVAGGAVSAVKGALGIKSPSRVFEEIGRNVVQGFANGVSANASIATAGLKTGLLFPIEQALADIQKQRDALQSSFDAADTGRTRAGLVHDLSAARGALSTARTTRVSRASTAASSGGAARSKMGGAAGQVFSFFRSNGFSDAQAAAFVGNFTQESGLNPGAVQAGGPGRGLAQWGGGRFTALQQFAKSRGTAWTNMQTQLAFVLKELNGPERAAGSAILGAHTLDSAVNAVGVKYERYGIQGDRSGPARAAFRRFAGRVTGSGGGSVSAARATALAQELAANQDKVAKLHAQARALPAGKKGTAERKAISDEVAGITEKNRKLRESLKGAKTDASRLKDAKKSVADATRALSDFNREQARAGKLAILDLKASALTKLQTFKGAIDDLKGSITDMATQAAAAWRKTAENAVDATLKAKLAAISTSDAAKELAGLQAGQSADQLSREDSNNQRAVGDAQLALDTFHDPKGDFAKAKARLDRAKASGNQAFVDSAQKQYDDLERQEADLVKAVEDAKYQIRDTARSRRITQLEQGISDQQDAANSEADAAKAGLDQQEADLTASLAAQLGTLVGNLEARKQSYRDFVTSVRSILGPYGQDFQGSVDQEAATGQGTALTGAEQLAMLGPLKVTATGTYRQGSTGKWVKIQNPDGSPVKRATGGAMRPGVIYRVGELGPENVSMGPDGRLRVSQASQSGRGGAGDVNVNMYGPVTIGSRQGAKQMGHTIAWRVATGA